jgi:hypothetical protein
MVKSIAALTAAVLVTAAFAAPAEAARKRSRVIEYGPRERVAMLPAPRARLTVRRRSYLDAGTEVNRGERKFSDYATPLGYLAASPTDPYRPGDIVRPTSGWWNY